MRKKRSVGISAIVPCYNEEDVVEMTYQRLKGVLKQIGLTYEMIFVNDGSSDNTLTELKRIARHDKTVKIISLSRNFGHEAATSAGIAFCKGDRAFIIDADLQDPPELLPEMLSIMERENCNVVYGVRKSRKGETVFKKITAKYFYRFLNLLSDIQMPVDTGDFRLIDRKVIDAYTALPEKNKYMRYLITWVGFKQVPLLYERHARAAGKTKYNYMKLFRLAFDVIFYFSKKPLQIAIRLGVVSIIFSFFLTIYTLIGYLFYRTPGWASTVIIIIFFGGVQLLTLGIIGEYIGSIFDEVKNRPQFIVSEKINFGK